MPLFTNITKGGVNEALVVGELKGSAGDGSVDVTRKNS
jgi:hypothetical protein